MPSAPAPFPFAAFAAPSPYHMAMFPSPTPFPVPSARPAGLVQSLQPTTMTIVPYDHTKALGKRRAKGSSAAQAQQMVADIAQDSVRPRNSSDRVPTPPSPSCPSPAGRNLILQLDSSMGQVSSGREVPVIERHTQPETRPVCLKKCHEHLRTILDRIESRITEISTRIDGNLEKRREETDSIKFEGKPEQVLTSLSLVERRIGAMSQQLQGDLENFARIVTEGLKAIYETQPLPSQNYNYSTPPLSERASSKLKPDARHAHLESGELRSKRKRKIQAAETPASTEQPPPRKRGRPRKHAIVS